MMLRLVLVGMVAALGVTIPGGTNRGGWLVSTGRWANSVLVDWDTWRPDVSAGQRRQIGSARHGCEQCRLARAALALRERAAAPSRVADSTKSTAIRTGAGSEKTTAESHNVVSAQSFRAPTPAFEPIEIGDDFDTDIVIELNRSSAGINLVKSAAAPSAILARSKPVALAADPEQDLPEVLCGVPDEDVADLVPMADASQRRAENEPTGGGSLISSETGDDVEPGETVATAISVPIAPPVVAASVQAGAATNCPELFEVFACQNGQLFNEDDAPFDDERASLAVVDDASKLSVVTKPAAPLIPAAPPVVAENSSQSQGRAADIPWPVFAPATAIAQPSTRVVQETTVPWPVFAPIDPIAGPVPVAKSLSSAAPPPRGSSPAAGWGQAVDLTRQAMCAWMGVLIGSAPVEVTAR